MYFGIENLFIIFLSKTNYHSKSTAKTYLGDLPKANINDLKPSIPTYFSTLLQENNLSF
jgi:hypothetical protein